MYELEDLKKKLEFVCEVLMESKDLLTHIDNLSGDGDLGISMERAALSVLREIQNNQEDGITGFLKRCAISINMDAPSTMGTLISLSVMETAKLMRGKDSFSIPDLCEIPQKMVETIMIYGRAQLGDKTVLDSLIPYAQSLRSHLFEFQNVDQAADAAAEEALRAAENTYGMVAKIGRAKWIGTRARNCLDGGAVVCALISNAMVGRRITFTVKAPEHFPAKQTEKIIKNGNKT